MESVKEFAQACLGSFEELTAALKKAGAEISDSMPLDELQWQFGRFKIWCGTLGALQSGKSSLDSRLRESSVVGTNVSKHLASLYRTLENSMEVVSGARLPLEKQPAYAYSSSESSSEESDDGEGPPLPEELVLHMRTIKEILSDLYKLSFRIRNQSTRASSTLRPKLYSEVDPDTGIDKFAAYKEFDQRHVEESLLQLRKDAIWQMKKRHVESTQVTNSDRYLTDRLVTTMNKRRKALRYWQRHAQKLNEIPSEAKDAMKPRMVPKPQVAKAETRIIAKKSSEEGHFTTPSLAEKTMLSETEATRFGNHLENILETQSIISYAPTLLGLHGDGVDLPAPPPTASERSEFLCSYCGLVCPARHGEGRAWRSHILHDLQPYICTYERCEDGDHIFSSYTAWLEHERLSHRRVWQCFEHNEPKFQSKAELRNHLRSEHRSNITETQIQSLIDVSESSVAETRTTCPFCLLEGPFSKGFENHLASHMLTFATFAVPRDELAHGNDDVNPDESQSVRAQGLGSQDSEVSESLQFDSQPQSAKASNADHQAFQSPSQSISDETSLSDVDHYHILREEASGVSQPVWMRLLERKPNGEIVFRELTSGVVPPYATLSHTWGEEEVIFQDMEAGADMTKAMRKAGWRKIEFCAKQATADGLQYFWVDTCCIDKKNAVEVGAAINSMFRWYQNAACCYVYLSDVSKPEPGVDDQSAWERAFRKSRWFTRGWTLQELIAPRLVNFFSLEGERLGSKLSLESQIHEITGIANNALQGDALSNFSIKERRSWAEHRETTVEEDAAYCLIGIFDVSIVPNYGERKDQAFRRLEEEIHRLYKGVDFEQFAVGLNLASFPEAVQFVAREKELSKMHELLQDHSSRSCAILHGLGGIGKTQLANTYARRYKEKYTAIFWLNANDEDSLKLSFRDVAQQVLRHHPSNSVLVSAGQAKDLDQVVSVVKGWLDFPQNTRWLMIYDNFDNPKTPSNPDNSAVDIRQFLPRSDHGSIIITTRSSQVKHGKRIHIQKMPDIREGLEILSNTSGRNNIKNGASSAVYPFSFKVTNKIDPDALALVRELDGLPLALATAGAYLEQMSMSFSDYLRLYKVSWLKLQKTSPQLGSYENRSLHTTWQLSLHRIEQENAPAPKLLKLWAYFHRRDIWFELLRHGSSADDEYLQTLGKSELEFYAAIKVLRNYGLIESESSGIEQFSSGGYSMPSPVYSWATFVLNKEWDQEMARLALTCVASEIPSNEGVNWWIMQRRLLKHALKQKQWVMDGKIEIQGIEWALHNLGALFRDQDKLAEAEAMYVRALQGKEKVWGPEHTSTLDTVNNLGRLYADQGKLAEAEKMYVRALQGYEEALGPDHTSILSTVNNLGLLYAGQGKLAEAEKMYVRALQGYEEALGPDHTSTLLTVNNLAVLYAAQGKLVEAEQMYQRALQGKEKVWGPEHTSTLDTVNNLGRLYADQGKLAEAEKMYVRALQGYEEALGPNHTSTLSTVNNLGLLYAGQGKLAEAEKIYVRALQGYEEALGPNHTSTLSTVNNLGLLYAGQGKLAEAEKMYVRALQGYEEALGPDHTSTLSTVNNLGLLYAGQGKLAEAEKMYVRALQGYEEALGPDHTSTLLTVNNLGRLYADQGKLAEAEKMYVRALQGYEEALGPDHTSTLSTVNNLGLLYADQGKLAEAEKMYVRALQGKEKAWGPEHTSTLDTVNNLAVLYANQGKLAEAEKMYVWALQGYEDALGPQLESYLPALNTLFVFGDLLSQTGRKDMAKGMYARALSGYTVVHGPSSKWCRQLEDRLQALQVA